MSGKEIQLHQIFRADDQAVVVAIDLGQFKRELKGLERVEGSSSPRYQSQALRIYVGSYIWKHVLTKNRPAIKGI